MHQGTWGITLKNHVVDLWIKARHTACLSSVFCPEKHVKCVYVYICCVEVCMNSGLVRRRVCGLRCPPDPNATWEQHVWNLRTTERLWCSLPGSCWLCLRAWTSGKHQGTNILARTGSKDCMLLTKDLAGEPQVKVINVLDRVLVKWRDSEVCTGLQVCVML